MKQAIHVYSRAFVFIALVVISILTIWYSISVLISFCISKPEMSLVINDIVLFFLLIFGWVPAMIMMNKIYGED